MQETKLTPLKILAISMAYEIQADKRTSPQEKAKLVTLFGKLVEMGTLQEGELHALINWAFEYARKNRLEPFLKQADSILSYTQKMAVLINLYDVMQVDGYIKMGERGLIQAFKQNFGIDARISRGVREFLMLKNDTSIFIDDGHPLNNETFDFSQLFLKP